MSVIDDYLAKNASDSQRVELEKIRALIKELVPEAEESMGYGMPAFKYKGKAIVYFAAFKDHMSLFPTGDQKVMRLVGVKEFQSSKGTLQFTETKLIPQGLVKEIIKTRLKSLSKAS